MDLANIENLQAYLKTSLRHAWGRVLRKRALERARELRIDQPSGDGPNDGQLQIAIEDRLDGEGVLDEKITADHLERAIEKLDPVGKAFVALELRGMSSRQIAAELGIKPNRAERIMTRTHRRLKSLLLSDDVMQGGLRK